MKAEVKGFGNVRSKDRKDTRVLCGKIGFIAQSEVDAVQLAALYRAWFLEDDPQGLLAKFRKNALDRYCKENNVTLRVK